MKNSLHILLEQPRPKPNAKRVRPDLYGGDVSSDETGSDESTAMDNLLSKPKPHSVSQKCKRLQYSDESELIPEPFKSELESAVADAESNDKSSYVADHLCYMDDDSPYLALAGRLKNNSDYYFEIVKDGSDWRWIDVEDDDKAKPFEQY